MERYGHKPLIYQHKNGLPRGELFISTASGFQYQTIYRNGLSMMWVPNEHAGMILAYEKSGCNCNGQTAYNAFRIATPTEVQQWEG